MSLQEQAAAIQRQKAASEAEAKDKAEQLMKKKQATEVHRG